ncbi:cora-like Mg2+ transporter [Rostrohypoxylon terebratum]|nr:cora-like Mg2+ transporter [Rostrohypoxylon terebratum]
MSDHEEVASGSGYNTPVPELDDHRHQISSIQRTGTERARRGTVDTLYGSRQHLQPVGPYSPSNARGREFEEAVLDEDDGNISPMATHSRRPTFDSTTEQQRAVSPPNSVKAFAEARRRERALSVTDGRVQRQDDDDALHRTYSSVSRRSQTSQRSGRSKPATFVACDGASLATNKTAEDDVCFPMQDDHRHDQLHIDFDYLENFIASENAARRDSVAAQEALRAFPSLTQEPAPEPSGMVTVDGDFVDVPSGSLDISHEKSEEAGETLAPTKPAEKEAHLDPNRFSFFSSAWESTIHAAEFGDLVLPGEDLRGLFTFPQDEPDGVWWLNVNRPTEEEIRALCKAFGVHPLTIEDITTQEAREKIEIFSSYYFASFRSFNVVQDDDGPEYEPFNIYVIVFREGTLSFSFLPNTHASHVRKRISSLKEYVSLSSDWICYAFIDNIVDSFAPALTKVEMLTEDIEDTVFIARPEDNRTFLRKIGSVRKSTLALMRGLGGKADILKGFTKRCNEDYKVTPRMDIGLYLGDIQDHVVTMMTNLTHFEKILSRAHSNYLAQLTVDSISQGTETNKVLAKITFLASLIVPFNVITGLFGMNVGVPFKDVDNTNAFFVIVGCLVAFCVGCCVFARWKRMI